MERTVIDIPIILDAVREEMTAEQEPATSQDLVDFQQEEEEIDLTRVAKLACSFRNIYKIDNLRGFEQLTKLQLDNNIIERIENLSHLVNLEWLDLSFNNIKKIEGLDALTKLTDLSLVNNEISVIEGLDNLKQLNVLSLGNNNIESVDNITYLRPFRSLRLLNLQGNPVCKKEDFKVTVFAYLRDLKFLDYQRIDPAQVRQAREEKQADLLELEEHEKVHETEESAREATAQRKRTLADANMEGVDTLFDDMLQDDSELPKLKLLPGFDEILESFGEFISQLIEEFIDSTLGRTSTCKQERGFFEAAVSHIKKHNEKQAITRIQTFEALKKRKMRQFQESRDERIIAELKNELIICSDDMMDLEMAQVEQVAHALNEFENQVASTKNENVNAANIFFRGVENEEDKYLDKVKELVAHLLDRMANDQDEGANMVGLTDHDIQAFLADKDQVNSTVAGSHDNHLTNILKLEEKFMSRENATSEALVATLKKTEYNRNRHRVSEIYELVSKFDTFSTDHT